MQLAHSTSVPWKTCAGCQRLFDLVKVADPKLLKAFYFAMRDTLVAKDMEQASRIAYAPGSSWRRVVTLKARLTDPFNSSSPIYYKLPFVA